MVRLIRIKTADLTLIQKFVAFGLIPIFLTSFITEAYFIVEFRNQQLEAKTTEMQITLDRYIESLDDLIIRVGKIPQTLAIDPDIIHQHEEEFPDWFANILRLNPEIHNVYAAYETNGNLTVVYRNNSQIETQIYPPQTYQNTSQDWYDLPITQQEFVIQKAYFDTDFMKEWMISLLAPVFNETEDIIGIVGVDITLTQLNEITDQISEEPGYEALLLERSINSTRILAINDPAYLGYDIEQYQEATQNIDFVSLLNQTIMDNSSFMGQYFDNGTKSVFNLYSKNMTTPYFNWILIIKVPEQLVVAETNRILFVTLTISFISLMSLVVIFILLVNSISTPIISFVKTTREIARGNFTHTYPTKGGKEITDLSQNFNQMVEYIQTQIEKFKNLADLSPYPMALINLPHKIEYVNQNFKKTFNFDDEKMSTVQDFIDQQVTDPKEKERQLKRWDKILSNLPKALNSPANFSIASKSGDPLKFIVHLIQLDPQNVYFIFENITEREEQEKERIRRQKLESLSLIAGGIAHDFNNILMGILGNINLMQLEDNLPENAQESLKSLETAVLRARLITNQLLTFSKGGKPIKKLARIGPLIQDSINFIMHGSNCKVHSEIQDNLSPVAMDEGQISQVINNLLINAQQSMKEGGKITINVKELEIPSLLNAHLPPGDYIYIEIIDEGHGIPEKYHDKIFTPYFSLKEEGNGLGLATAYSIITKHNGYLGFDSEEGRGTTFYIYLPVSDGKPSDVSETVEELSLYSGRILVLEDNITIQQVLSQILQKIGFQVEFCTDGTEILEKYQKSLNEEILPYDLLIMDLTIPGGMGGKETMEELLKIDPQVKAFVSSGYSNDPILSNFRNFGFIGVLQKPYSLKELHIALKIVFNGNYSKNNSKNN